MSNQVLYSNVNAGFVLDPKFYELYNQVFNEKDEITACGRDLCKQLISHCNKINPDGNYGNANTGFLNIEAIVNLKNGQ